MSSDMTGEGMAITVNGEAHDTAAELTILQLLSELKVSADRVAVELNKRIVPKRDWATTRITAGAQLEIVQFVGGG